MFYFTIPWEDIAEEIENLETTAFDELTTLIRQTTTGNAGGSLFCYSVRKLSTGLALAAVNDWDTMARLPTIPARIMASTNRCH